MFKITLVPHLNREACTNHLECYVGSVDDAKQCHEVACEEAMKLWTRFEIECNQNPLVETDWLDDSHSLNRRKSVDGRIGHFGYRLKLDLSAAETDYGLVDDGEDGTIDDLLAEHKQLAEMAKKLLNEKLMNLMAEMSEVYSNTLERHDAKLMAEYAASKAEE